MKGHRFRALDGLRGVCALVVALYHYAPEFHFKALALIRYAWLFVDFFFVLSGFVTAYGFANKIYDGRTAGEFVLRRFGRLWPLHVAVLALFMLSELSKMAANYAGIASRHPAFSGSFPLRDLPTNLFLVQAINNPPTWNGVSWSISVEFWTYLVFCGFCLLPLSRRDAACAVLAIVGLVLVAVFSPNGMATDTVWAFFRCLYGFFTGVLTFRLWRLVRVRRPHSSLAEIVIAAAVILIFHFAYIPALTYVAPMLFAAVILFFAHGSGLLSATLCSTPAQRLGLWSYGIYMVHPFVAGQVMTRTAIVLQQITGLALVTKFGAGSDGVPMTVIAVGNLWIGDLLVVCYFAMVIALAALAHRWIEKPGRRLFNQLGHMEARD